MAGAGLEVGVDARRIAESRPFGVNQLPFVLAGDAGAAEEGVPVALGDEDGRADVEGMADVEGDLGASW